MKRIFHSLRLGAVAVALAAGVLAASALAADEIVLKNGSRILGTVTGVRDGVVTVDTEFAGTLKVQQDQVESLRSSESIVLKLADGTVVEEPSLRVEEETLLLASESAPVATVPLADLAISDPQPWELGHGYRWKGQVSLALEMQRGNTDTDELDYGIESVWRSLEDRYTLRFDGEEDEANGVKNAENWTALGKYDRFLEGPLYWGVNASAEHDKFSDLDLRYYVGPYIGRQFHERPLLTLSAEVGGVYVDEDYIVAEDQDYLGMNWSVDATSNYISEDSQLYLKHTGIWNLDQTEDVILDLTLGLSFPLLFNIDGAAEILLEYDSGLPPEVESLDQTYRFRVGYSW
ncbi:MAG: DUF481 domain-containing protein [Halieaceae bacterium]|jgi:hypothetical protein|uniref:DUF481 domain-containing protein n=1 Tax=Haliea alexandrii TaxID=2448162 RepID=UPI000F0B8D8D|nr:DUF481 domain-containing protein [Haliea alexandrii]MCR9185585.1 DUF481 domain-containing protein [Halieaceae bacterium]